MTQYACIKFASESQEPLNYSGQLDRKLVQICDVQDGITIDPFNILLVVTDRSSYRKFLKPGQAPNVKFHLDGEKPLAVFAYCNLHGLWKTELS